MFQKLKEGAVTENNEVHLPSHLITVVKICRYLVFCTLKNVKGPNNSKNVV